MDGRTFTDGAEYLHSTAIFFPFVVVSLYKKTSTKACMHLMLLKKRRQLQDK